jgi:pilus assembly protein Flp/PilA
MKNLMTKVQNFINDESGPTAVEYAVMLALIIVVCITAVTAIGNSANTQFLAVDAALQPGGN